MSKVNAFKAEIIHPIVWLTPSTLLILALFELPIGYYDFLRLVVFGASVYFVHDINKLKKEKDKWFFIYIGIAILFNPLFPIHLEREVWAPIDIVVALFFLIHFYRNQESFLIFRQWISTFIATKQKSHFANNKANKSREEVRELKKIEDDTWSTPEFPKLMIRLLVILLLSFLIIVIGSWFSE